VRSGGATGYVKLGWARAGYPSVVGEVLGVFVYVGPLFGIPLGLGLLATRGPGARLGGAGAILLVPSYGFLAVEVAKCLEGGRGPCGAPDWVILIAGIAVVAGLLAVIAAACAYVVSRARRSRSAR
jgi:hypothetical protein